MLYVKMMTDSRSSLADDHPHKRFTIIPVKDTEELTFDASPGADEHAPHVPTLFIKREDGSYTERVLTGNVYVMNEAGKTIASHGY